MLLDLLQRALETLRHILRPLEPRLLRKRTAELSYWKRRHVAEGGAFGKGSLAGASSAALRIGIGERFGGRGRRPASIGSVQPKERS